MLDSLVRVSRRVGWVTDLLAASLRPPTGPSSRSAPAVRSPTPTECGGAAAFARDDLSRHPAKGGGERAPEGVSVPRSSDVPPTGRLTTGDAHSARHRPPAITRLPGRHVFQLPDRLRRPRSGRQMRLASQKIAVERPPFGEALLGIFDQRDHESRLNPPATGFRGPTRLPLSSFTYS